MKKVINKRSASEIKRKAELRRWRVQAELQITRGKPQDRILRRLAKKYGFTS